MPLSLCCAISLSASDAIGTPSMYPHGCELKSEQSSRYWSKRSSHCFPPDLGFAPDFSVAPSLRSAAPSTHGREMALGKKRPWLCRSDTHGLRELRRDTSAWQVA
eukprot:3734706-Pleurochrysis_carterae.AAC.1